MVLSECYSDKIVWESDGIIKFSIWIPVVLVRVSSFMDVCVERFNRVCFSDSNSNN